MDEIYNIASYWAWFIAAMALAIAEIAVAPGIFFIFIAGAAACVGIVTAFFTISLATQLILFGILSVISVYLGRRYYQKSQVSNEDPMLNDRTARMIGQSATVIESLTPSDGRVSVGGSEWPARGPNMKIGDIGRVANVDNGVLVIEAAN